MQSVAALKNGPENMLIVLKSNFAFPSAHSITTV
jgi:hypothetical protein